MADDPKDPKDPKDDPKDPPARGGKPTDDDLAELKAALRKANKEAETNRLKLKELEDKDKSDSEKLTARVAELEGQVAQANSRVTRYEVALEKGLTKTQARRLVGDTEEELAADADDLLSSFTPGSKSGSAPSKPTEDLKGGGDPTEEPSEMDPRKLAEAVPRY